MVTATLVLSHAGETVPLLTTAVMHKMTPSTLATVIYSYPTQALAVQTVADQAQKRGVVESDGWQERNNRRER